VREVVAVAVAAVAVAVALAILLIDERGRTIRRREIPQTAM
jgi:hypothetical protein